MGRSAPLIHKSAKAYIGASGFTITFGKEHVILLMSVYPTL